MVGFHVATKELKSKILLRPLYGFTLIDLDSSHDRKPVLAEWRLPGWDTERISAPGAVLYLSELTSMDFMTDHNVQKVRYIILKTRPRWTVAKKYPARYALTLFIYLILLKL